MTLGELGDLAPVLLGLGTGIHSENVNTSIESVVGPPNHHVTMGLDP